MKPRQLELFPKPPRKYAVSVYGWDTETYMATTPGKARAQAYRAFCDAYSRRDFHWFLVNSRVWRAVEGEAA